LFLGRVFSIPFLSLSMSEVPEVDHASLDQLLRRLWPRYSLRKKPDEYELLMRGMESSEGPMALRTARAVLENTSGSVDRLKERAAEVVLRYALDYRVRSVLPMMANVVESMRAITAQRMLTPALIEFLFEGVRDHRLMTGFRCILFQCILKLAWKGDLGAIRMVRMLALDDDLIVRQCGRAYLIEYGEEFERYEGDGGRGKEVRSNW
jgi:hypothetical protein